MTEALKQTMRLRVIERGFLRGERVFETPVRWIDAAESAALAEKHTRAIGNGSLDMVELEFPDCPIEDRFFRIGKNPQGMRLPIEIDLEKL